MGKSRRRYVRGLLQGRPRGRLVSSRELSQSSRVFRPIQLRTCEIARGLVRSYASDGGRGRGWCSGAISQLASRAVVCCGMTCRRDACSTAPLQQARPSTHTRRAQERAGAQAAVSACALSTPPNHMPEPRIYFGASPALHHALFIRRQRSRTPLYSQIRRACMLTNTCSKERPLIAFPAFVGLAEVGSLAAGLELA